jgi:hypothetical protein
MEIKGNLTLLAIAFAAFTSVPASAAGPNGLPPVQTQNGITYRTGGIGQPASTALRAAADRYSLMMTFAENNGAFLNDIKVRITDRRGRSVLDILSGPILLVDLPPGWYKVQARFAGDTLVKTVQVKGGQHGRLAYAWPESVVRKSEFSAFEALPSEKLRPPHTQGMNPQESWPRTKGSEY